MSQITFDIEKTLAPSKAIAELTLQNIEKFVGFNVDLYTKYSAMTLESTKEVLSIADLETAQAFFSKQTEKTSAMIEVMVGDAKAAAEMGQSYSDELKKLLASMGETTVEAVKAAAPVLAAVPTAAAEAVAPAAEVEKKPAKKPAAKKVVSAV